MGDVSRQDSLDLALSRLRLAKVWLCLLIGISTLFGYVLATGGMDRRGLLTGLGIFLLGMGGASLNSCQEVDLDSRMQRTKNRPLVTGKISMRGGLVQAALFAGCGLLLLWCFGSYLAAFFGVAGIGVYNGVYTPLKKRSIAAIIPGGVCGAIPPCVGWAAGGGSVTVFEFWLLFTLFFLWQLPHFWLVMLKNRQDYLGGPFPSLLDRFPDGVVRGFFIPWVGALVVVMLLFSILPGVQGGASRWWIVFNCFGLAGLFLLQFNSRTGPPYRVLFIALNMALVFHMGAVSFGVMS